MKKKNDKISRATSRVGDFDSCDKQPSKNQGPRLAPPLPPRTTSGEAFVFFFGSTMDATPG